MAKRPNGRLAQVLGTPVKFPSDSRANAIPWHRSSSSQKALWCRGALRVGGVRWAVEVSLGLSLKLLSCNPFSNLPKPDLPQLSLPQSGHQHLLHCALRLGSFGTSWITCTSLIPWATSCSPKTALYNQNNRGLLQVKHVLSFGDSSGAGQEGAFAGAAKGAGGTRRMEAKCHSGVDIQFSLV